MKRARSHFRVHIRRALAAVTLAAAALAVYARITRESSAFAGAAELPRGALVYVQVGDLPALIARWNESDFRRKYLASENYRDFAAGHLPRKLAARFEEIGGALGFAPDLGVLSRMASKNAAVAIYDVGRLEFIFVAPLGADEMLANAFFQTVERFETIELAGGVTVYRTEAEVDRGRQRQRIFFASLNDRFVLATSEKHFLHTLELLQNRRAAGRLADEPAFRELAARTEPNLATVWVDLERLGADWYFRHYWLMSPLEELAEHRAGMFDFALDGENLIERRVYLLRRPAAARPLGKAAAARLLRLVPDAVPFYRLRATPDRHHGARLRRLLHGGEIEQAAPATRAHYDHYFSRWEWNDSFAYLDAELSSEIDETDETAGGPDALDRADAALEAELDATLDAARPAAEVTVYAPRTQAAPLFFDDRRALVVSLAEPGALSVERLERNLAASLRRHLSASARADALVWEDWTRDKVRGRRLKLPALGREFFYARAGAELVLADSVDLFAAMLAGNQRAPCGSAAFDSLTVVRLDRRAEAFTPIFARLAQEEAGAKKNAGRDLFAGSIASLLDALDRVERVEISGRAEGRYRFEEIRFVLGARRPAAE